MKTSVRFTVLVLFTIICFAFHSKLFGQNKSMDATSKPDSSSLVPVFVGPSDWLDSFDLDGDGNTDHIFFDYSGGAHCCYKIHIVLSKNGSNTDFPFEMDGGYLGQVDNSIPEQFTIKDADGDGLPEILMTIQTYNGEPDKIPHQWEKEYSISSHHIMIDYEKGKLVAKDYMPTLHLTGIWQSSSVVASGWTDNYQFFDNGTFNFNYNQMKCDNRTLSLSGIYTRPDNLSIELTINKKTILAGGKRIKSQGSCASEYEIEGGQLKTLSLKKNEIEKLQLQDYFIDKEDGRSLETMLINGVRFWKIMQDPNNY